MSWLTYASRWLGQGLTAILLALVLAAAGIWWWTGTEGSLLWALQRFGPKLSITAEGVSGSLRSGLRVERLVWRRESLTIEARDVHAEWQPRALFSRTLQLDELNASSVQITQQVQQQSKPPQVPSALGLPMRISAPSFYTSTLRWQGRRELEAHAVAGGYSFDGQNHRLRLDSADFAQGRYRGEARLGAAAPLPVQITLHGSVTTAVPGSPATLPLTIEARASGPLSELQVQAFLRAVQAPPGGSAPNASVTARITPFESQPLPQASADLQHVDLAPLWPKAPRTSLSGHVDIRPEDGASWQVSADLRNARAGPWDRGLLPLDRLRGEGQWREGITFLRRFDAGLGRGQLQGSGRWSPAGWSGSAQLRNVDAARVHTALAAVPVSGQAQAQEEGRGVAFQLDLTAGAVARRNGGKQLVLQRVQAKGRWEQGLLDLPSLQARVSDATLRGSLRVRPATRAASGRIELQAPGASAWAEGSLSRTRGEGKAQAKADDLGRLQQWLAQLPKVPDALSANALKGRATLQGAWQGGWADPAIQATLTAPRLSLAEAAQPWELRDALATWDGRLRDARVQIRTDAVQGQRRLAARLEGRAGLADNGVWRAEVRTAALAAQDPAAGDGTWRLDLQSPVQARWWRTDGRAELGAGEAVLKAPVAESESAASQALLSWQAVRWDNGELQSAGRLTGLPLRWLELLGGGRFAGGTVTGDMVFDGEWDASLGRTLRLNASLTRVGGDLTVLAETAEGGSARVSAGVRQARVSLQSADENVTLTVRWDSERAGNAEARLVSRLARTDGGWQWSQSAPVGGFIRAQLPRIGVWSLLAPPGWRLRGSLVADVSLVGTRAEPRFSGALQADDLGLRSVVDGVELRDGLLRARLEGQQVRIEQFVLHGAGGRDADGGTVNATGEVRWVEGRPQLTATAQLQQLRASIRPERQLTVSGRLTGQVDPGGTAIRGNLVVDRARIQIPEETRPQLDDDVVVRNAPGHMETAGQRRQRDPQPPPRRRPFGVAVQIDLGPDFHVQGRGIDTRLAGSVAVSGESLAQPRLEGVIRSVRGEFRAYGQQLEIERGVLRFTGPADNPALDVLALRPRLEQRVGVQVTGRAQAPVIRLYSEPEMADAQKLALLVTGREAPVGGAEAALVQQAALALLGTRRGRTPGRGIAGRLGLEELSLRRDAETGGAVVALGKRFSRDLYASYERSLSAALGTLFVFYDVSRRLTVRAQAGERTGVDLLYTFSYD